MSDEFEKGRLCLLLCLCRWRRWLQMQGPSDAVRLFRLAADEGDAGGQYNLAQMYAQVQGTGVSQDDTEAVRLYCLAADQGLAGGQFRLRMMWGPVGPHRGSAVVVPRR